MSSMQAVAIDGPAGAGKSTIARAVAAKLGFLYVDTGAMYRAVALKASHMGVELDDEDVMGHIAVGSHLAFDETGTRILLDDEDVSTAIRSPEITSITKYAARAKPVRIALIKQQQDMARSRPVVMEGRDITTVVLKDARWKVFLTADPEERARRRMQEMEAAGHEVDFQALLDEIIRRDESDMQVGPLAEASVISETEGSDIMRLDTTGMTPEMVIDAIASYVKTGTE